MSSTATSQHIAPLQTSQAPTMCMSSPCQACNIINGVGLSPSKTSSRSTSSPPDMVRASICEASTASTEAAAKRQYTLEQRAQEIQDNFRGFTPLEAGVNMHDELTLRARITKDLNNHEAGREPRTMGAHYYGRLRRFYKEVDPATQPQCDTHLCS